MPDDLAPAPAKGAADTDGAEKPPFDPAAFRTEVLKGIADVKTSAVRESVNRVKEEFGKLPDLLKSLGFEPRQRSDEAPPADGKQHSSVQDQALETRLKRQDEEMAKLRAELKSRDDREKAIRTDSALRSAIRKAGFDAEAEDYLLDNAKIRLKIAVEGENVLITNGDGDTVSAEEYYRSFFASPKSDRFKPAPAPSGLPTTSGSNGRPRGQTVIKAEEIDLERYATDAEYQAQIEAALKNTQAERARR
jgi:hypothetical protein